MTLSPLAYAREADRLSRMASRASTIADVSFGDSAELAKRQAARLTRQAHRFAAMACQLTGRCS